jgi:undecaprenyl-diphosphatase
MDLYLFNLINQYAGKWDFLDKLAIFFANQFQNVLFVALVLLLLINFKKYFPMMVSAAGAILLSRIVITEAIRFLFFRPRPFLVEKVNLILPYNPAEASFPSGHAAFFFALAMAIYLQNKKLGLFFFVSAFLVTIPRVFGGIHWPSDILAGALIGIFSGWLVHKILKKIL